MTRRSPSPRPRHSRTQWVAQSTGEAFDPQASGPCDIAEYGSDLLIRGKKAASVNRRLGALQRFYKWAQQQGHTTNNPFEVLDGVRVKQGDA
jgi:site-specific recombinase XerD